MRHLAGMVDIERWLDRMAELSRFFSWGPAAGFDMTISRLIFWNRQAHRMIAAGS